MFHVKQTPDLARAMESRPPLERLRSRLSDLEGEGYNAYRSVKGRYDARDFDLEIDHVQGDPYAQPSRFRAWFPENTLQLPAIALTSGERRVAAADLLNRRLARELRSASEELGSGNSGRLYVLQPGQEVMERTSVRVSQDGRAEVRFRVGLPARGRRILGRLAARLVVETLPTALRRALLPDVDRDDRLREHVEVVEDAVHLRRQLADRSLVAFVADGARLPRRSGIDDRPLEDGTAVPFRSPASLRVRLEAPNRGSVEGMGVPEGVTLIVGGGYHGKSTLLRAIERGVYEHVPGDGRERVVTVRGAVKVRAEDGRRVAGTDISNFIGRLPGGDDTARFRSENASGSTSQAAAIVEALEVGATCLLLDEDTSATNFMIRDARMQRLIASEHEPITPFIDRARPLHAGQGVSTVLVIGGSGDYFDVAHTVIAMRGYVPADVTAEARAVAHELPTMRSGEGGGWRTLRPRALDADSLDPRRGRRPVSIRVHARDRVEFGMESVDLAAVEQIVEPAQTRAIAHALVRGRNGPFRDAPDLPAACARLMDEVRRGGLEVVHDEPIGELSAFRVFELAAFLNRLRSLVTRPAGESS